MANKANKKDKKMRFKSSITLNEKDPSGKDQRVINLLNRVNGLDRFKYYSLSDLARLFLEERAIKELGLEGQLNQAG